MSYGGGTHIAKWQWDEINDPAWVSNPFESDEAGMKPEKHYIILDEDGLFFTPVGNPFVLKKGVKIFSPCLNYVDYPNWPVYIFEENGIEYVASTTDYLSAGRSFNGYVKRADKISEYSLKNETLTGKGIFVVKNDSEEGSSQYLELQRSTQSQEYKYTYYDKIRESGKPEIFAPEVIDATSKMNPCNSDGKKINEARYSSGKGQILNHAGGLLSPDEINKLSGLLDQTERKLGISSKLYLLSKSASDYEQRLKEAESDPSLGKSIYIIDKEEKRVDLLYTPQVPDWIREILKDVRVNDCMIDYINKSLSKLRAKSQYQSGSYYSKIADEYLTLTYHGFFGMLYCATEEEAVAKCTSVEKFIAGGLHELIGFIDINAIIEGVVLLVEKGASTVIESNQSFISDIRQTFSDLHNGVSLSPEELIKRLCPPGARSDLKLTRSIQAMGSMLIYTYQRDCLETDPAKQTGLCPYRYGQASVIVVPIVFTAGGWAAVKATEWAGRLIEVFGKKADDAARLVAEAEKLGYTVVREEGSVIIKNGEEITTIAKSGDELVISTANGGRFAKFSKIDNWFNSLSNSTLKTNIENILKNWSDDLLTKLDNIPTSNPNFLKQVESNPSILNYFEEGSKVIFNKAPNLKAVELDMYALDRFDVINSKNVVAGNEIDFVSSMGKYELNPTATNIDNLEITVSGKIKGKKNLNPNSNTYIELNGEEFMYVIDESDNIIIGTRVKNSDTPNYELFKGKAPHPTLIGGINPNVKAAGTIEFRGGLIYKVDNASGHFKPNASTMDFVERLFKQKFDTKSFDKQLYNSNNIFKKIK
jgi:hypothetical protein